MYNKIDITKYLGKKINEWTILRYSHVDKKGQQYWLVECSCGLIDSRRASHLTRKLTKMCNNCRLHKMKVRNVNHKSWTGGKYLSGSFMTALKHSANNRNLELSVDISYLEDLWEKQNEQCAYTGEQLSFPICLRESKNSTASLDRIDSTKGYIKENVQWVCKKVNILKKDMGHKEFLDLCKAVYLYNKLSNEPS